MLMAYEGHPRHADQMIEIRRRSRDHAVAGDRRQRPCSCPSCAPATGFLDGMLDLVPGRASATSACTATRSAGGGRVLLQDARDMHERDASCSTHARHRQLGGGGGGRASSRRPARSRSRFVCLLAAPEGLVNFREPTRTCRSTPAAIDRELNDHGYILPGLGDAGDGCSRHQVSLRPARRRVATAAGSIPNRCQIQWACQRCPGRSRRRPSAADGRARAASRQGRPDASGECIDAPRRRHTGARQPAAYQDRAAVQAGGQTPLNLAHQASAAPARRAARQRRNWRCQPAPTGQSSRRALKGVALPCDRRRQDRRWSAARWPTRLSPDRSVLATGRTAAWPRPGTPAPSRMQNWTATRLPSSTPRLCRAPTATACQRAACALVPGTRAPCPRCRVRHLLRRTACCSRSGLRGASSPARAARPGTNGCSPPLAD